MRAGFLTATLLFLTASTGWPQDATPGKPLTLLDHAGKEITLKNATFTTGTKRLSWLDETVAPTPKDKKAAPPTGPEYLEFRERKTPMYKDDVTTYIPITAIKQIDYDPKAREVSVTIWIAKDEELNVAVYLHGSTVYAGINKFNLDGEIEAGTLNVQGPIKLQDGFLRAGIRSIRFPDAKPVAAPSGANAIVIPRGKEKTKHEVGTCSPSTAPAHASASCRC